MSSDTTEGMVTLDIATLLSASVTELEAHLKAAEAENARLRARLAKEPLV